MSSVWMAIKKSLSCKSSWCWPAGDGRPSRSGCSKLSDIDRGNVRSKQQHPEEEDEQEQLQRPPTNSCCSPRSVGSNEFLSPITHEVVLTAGGSKCELRVCTAVDSPFVPGALQHGAQGPDAIGGVSVNGAALFLRCSTTPVRRSPKIMFYDHAEGDDKGSIKNPNISFHAGQCDASRASCDAGIQCTRCGYRFAKLDGLEAHHLSKHAVTELAEGISSRKIVEIICKAGWFTKSDQSRFDNSSGLRMERILKVHNMQHRLTQFEDYRESVKLRASKLIKKHPRCIADGNELLRFHGTTVRCSLGANSSSGLCTSARCNACRIIRHGFSETKDMKESIGVFTASTSRRALENIQLLADDICTKKALLVCRVIAGRIHRPTENLQDVISQTEFNSVAGKVSLYSNIEELYLLSTHALLPCFVVICKA